MGLTGSPEQLSWFVVPASQFPGGVEEVADAVAQNRVWVAVTSTLRPLLERMRKCSLHSICLSVNPGASNNLTAATVSADPLYNGTLAVTAYAAEARNEIG